MWTVGGYCVMKGRRKNEGHHFTAVSLPKCFTHMHTQRQKHTRLIVPTDIWGFLVSSPRAAGVAAHVFSCAPCEQADKRKSLKPLT